MLVKVIKAAYFKVSDLENEVQTLKEFGFPAGILSNEFGLAYVKVGTFNSTTQELGKAMTILMDMQIPFSCRFEKTFFSLEFK